eukprot:CAMPEP_0194093796 /NCGR_PEP_ID=MMETSP0149-20130528/51594_1 /TAXON_ID=122233 /ORGANISM="Chaetoceros debilis, Strain MM31A-1" /LENGTH=49 /DNA_ID=CAMNT_0038779227 /DNA_START=60 /DNA_END=209 /DNA_ORIENTATION=+
MRHDIHVPDVTLLTAPHRAMPPMISSARKNSIRKKSRKFPIWPSKRKEM